MEGEGTKSRRRVDTARLPAAAHLYLRHMSQEQRSQVRAGDKRAFQLGDASCTHHQASDDLGAPKPKIPFDPGLT
jgi:hypothetical protein